MHLRIWRSCSARIAYISKFARVGLVVWVGVQDAYLHVRGYYTNANRKLRNLAKCYCTAHGTRNSIHITRRTASWNGARCERRDQEVGSGIGNGQDRFMHTECIPTHFDASHRIHGQLIYNRNKASSFSINRKLNPFDVLLPLQRLFFLSLLQSLSLSFFFISERSLLHNPRGIFSPILIFCVSFVGSTCRSF